MKKQFLVVTLLLITVLGAKAQTKIKLEDIAKHVGDSVAVCGKVEGGRFLESSQNAPTLINVGGQYPNQLLTVVIYGQFRSAFTGQPEKDWIGKEICIKGKVELFKDKPQIIVRQAEQIEVPK